MKNLYQHPTNWVWLFLLWAGFMGSQTALAQTIPDVQWTKSGQGLLIKPDGTIVSTTLVERIDPARVVPFFVLSTINYSLAGDQLSIVGLPGLSIVGGPERPFQTSGSVNPNTIGAAPNGETAYTGAEYRTGNVLIAKTSLNGGVGIPKPVDIGGNYEELIGTPDGGFVLLVTSTEPTGKTVALVRKYDSALNVIWTKTVSYPTSNPDTPDRSLTRARTIINTPDGGFLLAGFINKTGNRDVPETGWVAKLNAQGDVAWQNLLVFESLSSATVSRPDPNVFYAMGFVSDAILSTNGNGYVLVGIGVFGFGNRTSIVELTADGRYGNRSAISTDPNPAPQSSIARYTSGGQSYYAVGTSTGGHPQILLVNPATLGVATQRVFNNSPAFGTLRSLAVAGDGSLVFDTSDRNLVKLRAETTGGFTLLQPTYNCQTGAITFNTSGGDGSPITYSAPGISRSSATSNSGTVEAGLRADPKTIPITGTQSGQTSTVIFDLAGFCSSTPEPPLPPPLFAVLAPTYNCQTGAITFNITGGNGSPITYSAPGIMRSSPTSNAGTVEPGLRADPKTIPITGTQSGQTSTFVFDLPGLCGRQGRIASPESGAGLQVVVLGNPTATAVSVAVSGAGGQALRLELLDARGSVLGHRSVEKAVQRETHTFELGQQAAGLFLVRAVSGQQSQTVKIIKQ